MAKSNTSILRLIFLNLHLKHITFQIIQKIHKFIDHVNISFIKHMLIIIQLIYLYEYNIQDAIYDQYEKYNHHITNIKLLKVLQ